jgi:CAAX protease family protein
MHNQNDSLGSVVEPHATAAKTWTRVGLGIALFALPLLTMLFRLASGPAQSSIEYVARELVLFAVFGALLWIIARGEKRPFTSIGWHTERPVRSILWGLLGAVLCAVALVACLGIISALGLKFGGDGKSGFSPPAWAVLITVLRAGVIEETFYRGYAIDRVQLLTGNRILAITLPLLVFAGAHYRQGAGGVLIALAMGGILTALFVKRRDLLAVMTAHFIVDFIPNVLLPLLSD